MPESVTFSFAFDPSNQTQNTASIAIGAGEVIRVDFDQAPNHFFAYLEVTSGGNVIQHDLDSDLRSFNVDIATDGDTAQLFLRAYRGVIEGTFESVASAESGGSGIPEARETAYISLTEENNQTNIVDGGLIDFGASPTIGQSRGITVSGTNVSISEGGLYSVQFSPQIFNSGQSTDFSINMNLDGVEVLNVDSFTRDDASVNTAVTHVSVSGLIMVPSSGGVLTFPVSVETTDVRKIASVLTITPLMV